MIEKHEGYILQLGYEILDKVEVKSRLPQK